MDTYTAAPNKINILDKLIPNGIAMASWNSKTQIKSKKLGFIFSEKENKGKNIKGYN